MLKELKAHGELRATNIGQYECAIPKFRNIDGFSKEINCNIRVKQRCPLSHTLFGIYIDKLEYWFE